MQDVMHDLNPPSWILEYADWFRTASDSKLFPDNFTPENEREVFEFYANNEFIPLRELNTLMWFSRAIDVSFTEFIDVLKGIRSNNSDNNREYNVWRQPKRSGGYRTISEPPEHLAVIQTKISKFLRSEFQPDEDICGFSGGSVTKALLPHTTGTWMLKVDLKDAFPNVHAYDILEALNKHLSWYIAKAIADVATLENKLPQGASSSPRLFDIACEGLDRYMRKLCRNYQATYTRYADNIFISVSSEKFPRALTNGALKIIENARSWRSGRTRRSGPVFAWHKLRICRMTNSTVKALGLNIINGQLCNTREWKKRFRKQTLHVKYLLDHGLPYDKEFKVLEGMVSSSQEKTLPLSLTAAFDEIYHRVYRIRRPWTDPSWDGTVPK